MSQKVVRFELNRAGVAALMKSGEMQGVLDGYANRALGRLGGGYAKSSYVGKTRANVSVSAESLEAKRENLKNNTILRSLK